MAAPVRIGGTLIGAIGLSGPSGRFTDDRIRAMGDRLTAVTRRLGGPAMSESLARQPDHGKLVGMSVVLMRDDLETAAQTIRDLGFEAIEVHGSHISPGMPGVTVYDAHAAAAGDLIRRIGLDVSTLNVVGDASFQPFDGPDALRATADAMGRHLRWAAAMGSPRILIWEGRVASASEVPGGPANAR